MEARERQRGIKQVNLVFYLGKGRVKRLGLGKVSGRKKASVKAGAGGAYRVGSY